MKRLPFIYRMIRGAIGKRFVIKHYAYGVVIARYPNMKSIIPSEAQKLRRRLFKKAVLYAQSIYAKPAVKEEKRRLMRRPKRFFQALMKEWFRKKEERKYWNERRLKTWKQNLALTECFSFSETSSISISQLPRRKAEYSLLE